jgi:putative FmdB family regulatory protein
MPIYEFACQDCGREFEVLFRSGTALECPQCHSGALEKKLSVFAMPTLSAPATAPTLPSACGSCGHPGGPGACGSN